MIPEKNNTYRSSMVIVDELNYNRTIAVLLMLASTSILLMSLSITFIISSIRSVVIEVDVLEIPQFFLKLIIIISIIIISVIILQLLIVVLHEGFHGIYGRYYGCRPRFGFKMVQRVLPVAYTVCEGFFTRGQFLNIVLAPFLWITTIGFLILIFCLLFNNIPLVLLVSVCISVNLAGCVGDFYVTYRLLRFPATVIIESPRDEDKPIIIWNERALLPTKPRVWDKVNIILQNGAVFFIVFIFLSFSLGTAVTMILFVPVTLIMDLLNIQKLNFLAWSFVNNPNEISATATNEWILLGLALLGAAIATFIYVKHLNSKPKREQEKKETEIGCIL